MARTRRADHYGSRRRVSGVGAILGIRRFVHEVRVAGRELTCPGPVALRTTSSVLRFRR